ncbi:MAG TPA: CDP-diacylglycerol--glycerol-3-phosphate 3-phosphatidyltransferase, partial [Gammaproteobacteria bacterium]|nr:CDP-diacylglycerol--glycerol-3-phosphate 3-phosphatidyltransferase [Gammaproteobacteria bacterium]
MNLPNVITLVRIVMIPAFVLIYMQYSAWSYAVAAGLFTVAAATDWLDGYLAR